MADRLLNYKTKSKYKGDGFLTCIVIILVAMLIASVSFRFMYSKVYIVGTSMAGTFNGAPAKNLPGGDYVYMMKNVSPERGDIVVINTDYLYGTANEKILIKRLIAAENDRVELVRGVLYLNGERVEEPYVLSENNTPDMLKNSFAELTVPEGYVFCMGDNRDDSVDSRSTYGFIPLGSIMGVITEWSMRYVKAVTAFNTFVEFTVPQKLGLK